jgi:hypothetical protein
VQAPRIVALPFSQAGRTTQICRTSEYSTQYTGLLYFSSCTVFPCLFIVGNLLRDIDLQLGNSLEGRSSLIVRLLKQTQGLDSFFFKGAYMQACKAIGVSATDFKLMYSYLHLDVLERLLCRVGLLSLKPVMPKFARRAWI